MDEYYFSYPIMKILDDLRPLQSTIKAVETILPYYNIPFLKSYRQIGILLHDIGLQESIRVQKTGQIVSQALSWSPEYLQAMEQVHSSWKLLTPPTFTAQLLTIDRYLRGFCRFTHFP